MDGIHWAAHLRSAFRFRQTKKKQKIPQIWFRFEHAWPHAGRKLWSVLEMTTFCSFTSSWFPRCKWHYSATDIFFFSPYVLLWCTLGAKLHVSNKSAHFVPKTIRPYAHSEFQCQCWLSIGCRAFVVDLTLCRWAYTLSIHHKPHIITIIYIYRAFDCYRAQWSRLYYYTIYVYACVCVSHWRLVVVISHVCVCALILYTSKFVDSGFTPA